MMEPGNFLDIWNWKVYISDISENLGMDDLDD